MRPALALSTLLLGGCCCGIGGGGPSGGLGDRFGDAVGEKMQEKMVEKVFEASTGHELDIAAGGEVLFVETDEGKLSTYMNGKLPEGFDWPLPGDAKVQAATRLDPKDPAAGGPTWMVTYETTQDLTTTTAALKAEAEKRGYKVTSTNAAMALALEEAKAQGVTIDPAMTGLGNPSSDMLAFESSDPNKSGGALVDASTPGKTSVVLTVR